MIDSLSFLFLGRCSMLSELSIITFDGNNAALYSMASYILVRIPGEIIVAHIEKCSMNQVGHNPFSCRFLMMYTATLDILRARRGSRTH